MRVVAVLAEVQRRDIRLTASGGRLRYDAPTGAMTDELRSALIGCKTDLLAMLSKDWQWTVANWPHHRWIAWRRRSSKLQPATPTVDQIMMADWLAYVELTKA